MEPAPKVEPPSEGIASLVNAHHAHVREKIPSLTDDQLHELSEKDTRHFVQHAVGEELIRRKHGDQAPAILAEAAAGATGAREALRTVPGTIPPSMLVPPDPPQAIPPDPDSVEPTAEELEEMAAERRRAIRAEAYGKPPLPEVQSIIESELASGRIRLDGPPATAEEAAALIAAIDAVVAANEPPPLPQAAPTPEASQDTAPRRKRRGPAVPAAVAPVPEVSSPGERAASSPDSSVSMPFGEEPAAPSPSVPDPFVASTGSTHRWADEPPPRHRQCASVTPDFMGAGSLRCQHPNGHDGQHRHEDGRAVRTWDDPMPMPGGPQPRVAHAQDELGRATRKAMGQLGSVLARLKALGLKVTVTLESA
jgi:hypothetical protein